RSAAAASGSLFLLGGCGGCANAREYEIVVARLRDAEPQELLAAETAPAFVDAIEMRAPLRQLGIELVRRLQARLHHRAGESPQLRAAGNQPAQRLRILGVVAREHVNVGLRAGRLQR